MHLTVRGWISWLWFVKCLLHLSMQTLQWYSKMWSWSTFKVRCNFREAAKIIYVFYLLYSSFFQSQKGHIRHNLFYNGSRYQSFKFWHNSHTLYSLVYDPFWKSSTIDYAIKFGAKITFLYVISVTCKKMWMPGHCRMSNHIVRSIHCWMCFVTSHATEWDITELVFKSHSVTCPFRILFTFSHFTFHSSYIF